jgi:hypothetical protein
MTSGPIGFWSYAHEDDAAEGGRIVRLRERIQAEYKMLTGSSLDIVVDREHLNWGQNFRARLESAIEDTSFFIPILTETYFQSNECRREFQQFVASARELGLERLVMSIRYSAVRDLSEDSRDTLKALAATMQYENWQDLRLEDEDSKAYRIGVNRLAQRLVDLTKESETLLPKLPTSGHLTRATTGVHESAEPEQHTDDDEDAPGYLEKMADFPAISQAWMAQIEKVSRSMNAVTAPFTAFTPSLQAADSQPNPFAAKIQITRRLATALDEPLTEFEADAQEYVAKLVAFDPIVQTMIETLRLSDDENSKQAVASIRGLVEASQEAIGKLLSAADTARRYRGMSKDLRPMLRRFETGLRNIADAQSIIDGWGEQLDAPRPLIA